MFDETSKPSKILVLVFPLKKNTIANSYYVAAIGHFSDTLHNLRVFCCAVNLNKTVH